MTKTLLLPAEILSRELDARLLQGVLGLERGWRVILGSKALMNRAIWRMPRSVYLCQTLTHKRLAMLKLLGKLGHVAVGWDEEGLIYLNRDVYMMRRVSSESLARLAGLVAWGRQSAEDLGPRAAGAHLTPQPFGNPRFDLLRPELRALHQPEVDAIRARHGDFVLINTNFSSMNPIISLHDLGERAISKKDKAEVDEKAPQSFNAMIAHRIRIYDFFRSDLPELARRAPELKFIIRPHPAEDLQVWRDAAAGVENLEVVREGASIPWLMAARGLVHNSCTTAVEAAIIGHTPISYGPEVDLVHESPLPNPISHRVSTIDDLVDAARRAAQGALPMGEAQSEILHRHVAGITGPLAVEAILDFCETLENGERRRPTLAAQALTRAGGAVRHFKKTRRKDHITDRYLSKVFPPITSADVASRANQVAAALDLDLKVEARQLSFNIFEIARAA